jgi:hypothetical protein
MNKQQTAVEWLAEQLYPAIALNSKFIDEFVEQAKEMEKQQIKDAYCDGEHQQGFQNEAEQYYKQTFGE